MRDRYLDIIRGLAALSVFLAHAAYAYFSDDAWISRAVSAYSKIFQATFWANGGLHPGVIVFIVLSGFCIHMPLARQPALRYGKGFWYVYAKRRIIRILPTFALGCALGIFAVKLTGQSIPSTNGIAEYFLYLGMISFGAFLPIGGGPPGNEILQTVIVECWLYVTYPLTLFAMRRFGVVALLVVAALFSVVPVLFILSGAEPAWAGSSWYTFYPYWVFGVLAADASQNKEEYGRISLWLVALAFVVYVLVCHLLQFKGAHYPKSILLALWAALLLRTLAGRKHRADSQLKRVAGKFGEMSYSFYAIHLPLITLLPLMIENKSFATPVLVQVGLLGFTLLITVLCFCAVELPSHKLAQSLRFRSECVSSPSGR